MKMRRVALGRSARRPRKIVGGGHVTRDEGLWLGDAEDEDPDDFEEDDDLEDDDAHMLISLNRRDRRVFDVYRLDVNTGELEMIAENPGNVEAWITDNDGRLRLAPVGLIDGRVEAADGVVELVAAAEPGALAGDAEPMAAGLDPDPTHLLLQPADDDFDQLVHGRLPFGELSEQVIVAAELFDIDRRFAQGGREAGQRTGAARPLPGRSAPPPAGAAEPAAQRPRRHARRRRGHRDGGQHRRRA